MPGVGAKAIASLTNDADPGERRAGTVIAAQAQVQVKQVENSWGDRTFERYRAGEPGALWHPPVHHEVKALDLVAGIPRGTHRTPAA
jgi:hypothetical protein